MKQDFKIIVFLTILMFSVFKTIGQTADLNCIQLDNQGILSSLLFENRSGSLTKNTDKTSIQQTENGNLFPNLTISGDFDGDGSDETALFYDYTYYPNINPQFIASKIVVLKRIGTTMIPAGTWFTSQKADLNFSNAAFTTSGDFNADGKTDIAILSNPLDSTAQRITILESNGTGFTKKEYFKTTRSIFNFSRVKYIVPGDFNNDGKADIAAFYNYAGTDIATAQKVFVFESTGSTFFSPTSFYSTTKATMDFSNLTSALPGDYNGDGKSDVACIKNDEILGDQAIIILENNNSNGLISKDYLHPLKNDLNFTKIKKAVSGQFNTDSKTDLAFLYDNVGLGTQNVFVYESSGNTFSPFKNYFSINKTDFSFDNLVSVVSGKFKQNSKVVPSVWFGNKKGAVTFGFDDGYMNAFRYGANYLTNQHLKGTFYVISNTPFNNELDYCNWDSLKYYNQFGHEICSHTANHRKVASYTGRLDSMLLLNALFYKSKHDLDSILKQNTISMSYPFGNFNYLSLTEAGKYFLNIRSSQDGYNLQTPFDFLALKSKYVSSLTSNDLINSWLITTETFGYHLSLMYHNIQAVPFNKNGDEYSFSLNDFKQNVAQAQQHNLWIDTQGNVYKYMRERNAMKLTTYNQFADSLVIKADDGLDNLIFNQELTLKVELPNSMNVDSVYTLVNGKQKKQLVFTENSKLYCFVNSIPDNKSIKISKMKIISALELPLNYGIYALHVRNNPQNNEAIISISGEIVDGLNLMIYNTLGQKIANYNSINQAKLTLFRTNIASGCLIFILQNKNRLTLAKTKALF